MKFVWGHKRPNRPLARLVDSREAIPLETWLLGGYYPETCGLILARIGFEVGSTTHRLVMADQTTLGELPHIPTSTFTIIQLEP